jgi:nitrogen fixation NifU-like protein
MSERAERADMLAFSDKVMAESSRPHHMMRMLEPDAKGIIHGCCGDTLEFYLRLDGDRIAEATFMTDGGESARAAGSVLTKMVQGLSLAQAVNITPEDVILALGGLPPAKRHCAALAVKTLKEAVGNASSLA